MNITSRTIPCRQARTGQGKKFQETVYGPGKNLTPLMTGLASAGNSIAGVISALTGFLMKHGTATVWVTASVVAYNAAIKAYALYQKAAAVVTGIAYLASPLQGIPFLPLPKQRNTLPLCKATPGLPKFI